MGEDIILEKKSKIKHHAPVFVMTVLFLAALGVAGYFYYQYRHAPQVAGAMEIESLVKKIGSVVSLPQNETPTLATVTNKDKLDNQPFFQKAENGDKILIYSDASKVILYRPSTGKVIDMSTVNVVKDTPAESTPQEPVPATSESPVTPTEEPTSQASAPVASPEPVDIASIEATVTLYNGSTKVGVTNELETKLNNNFPSLHIIAKDKAVKNNYSGDMVIDLDGSNTLLVKAIADALGGTVESALPAGEVKPDTDILIIVGNK